MRYGYAESSGRRSSGIVACRGEFVRLTQPLPSVSARNGTAFAEPRPEEAVLTSGLRQSEFMPVLLET